MLHAARRDTRILLVLKVILDFDVIHHLARAVIAFFEADHRSAYRGMDGFFEGGAMTESNLLMEIDVVAFFDGAFRLGATCVLQRKVDEGRWR